MSALELAVAFIFVSNAIFLVAAGVVLVRILNHTRTAHEALVQAAGETRNAGKQLQHVANASHDQLAKLSGSVAAGEAAGAGGGGGADSAALEKLSKQVQDLIAKMGKGGAAPAGAAAGSTEDGDAAPADDRPHRSELDRALAHNHRLKSTLAQLRLQLDEAAKTIAEMRRDQRIANNEAMENMRQLVDRLHGQLEQARKSSRDAERRAKTLEVELQKARDTIETAQTRSELTDLEVRLNQMQSENSSLSGEVNELKELIQRTLREKNFIEDRFLQLDSALDSNKSEPATA